MLTGYIKAAMRRAHYEILSDDGSFYGEIEGFALRLRQRRLADILRSQRSVL
jgi:hypothetical protein